MVIRSTNTRKYVAMLRIWGLECLGFRVLGVHSGSWELQRCPAGRDLHELLPPSIQPPPPLIKAT